MLYSARLGSGGGRCVGLAGQAKASGHSVAECGGLRGEALFALVALELGLVGLGLLLDLELLQQINFSF